MLVSAAPALAVPQIASDAAGDLTVLEQVLWQGSRPLLAASAPAGGEFGAVGPVSAPLARDPRLAVDERGGAVAAWLRPTLGLYAWARVMVAVKPPGGTFGSPEEISAPETDANDVELDVNPRGDAIVVWWSWARGVEYAFRPAGGSFTPPAAVPGPHTEDVRVFLDADGGAVFLGDGSLASGVQGPSATYRAPDGEFGKPTPIPGAPRLPSSAKTRIPAYPGGRTLTANRRGDILYAWTAGSEVKTNERPAGGTFGPPITIGPIPPGTSEYGDVSTASALNDAGDAVLLVSSSTLVAFTRVGPGGFGQPQTLASSAHTIGASIDEAGRAAGVWITPRRRIGASYREAGGAFGRVAQLASVPFRIGSAWPPPLAPGIAFDGQGVATVVWEESDGGTVRLRSRRLTPAGAAAATTIAAVPAFVQEAPPGACFPLGGTIVASSPRSVIVRTVSPDTTTGCLLGRGYPIDVRWVRPYPVGDTSHVAYPPRVALAGPFAALLLEASSHSNIFEWISIVDLRDEVSGQSRNAAPLGLTSYPQIPVIRVQSNGAAAWVACRPSRARCARGAKQIKYVLAFGLESAKPHVVGRGTRIDPRSLKLRGDRVFWQDGARRRSAKL